MSDAICGCFGPELATTDRLQDVQGSLLWHVPECRHCHTGDSAERSVEILSAAISDSERMRVDFCDANLRRRFAHANLLPILVYRHTVLALELAARVRGRHVQLA